MGEGGRLFNQINPKFFVNYGYACLYACKTAGNWGAADSLARSIGKGFLVEGNTAGLNFTGISGGRMGQGLPRIVPMNYSGSVYLQYTERVGKWIFYRGKFK